METTQDTITVPRPPQTAQLTPSIKKPVTPSTSPEIPPAKRTRTKSPKYTSKQPTRYFHVKIEDEYPLHEKYDLQDVHATTYKVIIKATRIPREDEELNIDLPVFFVYQKENRHWLHQGANQQVLWWPVVLQHWDADGSQRRETDQHGSLVRRPGKVMPGSLRGWWRTTATSACAAKLSWQDLLSTGGTRTRVRTPKKSKGEDTLSALEWGHSLGIWVRTLSLLLGEDTHSSASGWGHPLGSWVRTPTLHPFRRPIDDMWPLSETFARLELSA